MAIKINGQNLIKRIINGQEVSRIILNGSQIRPTEEQHINYHIVSDWTIPGGGGGSGNAPSGWSNNGGIITGGGVTNGNTGYPVNQKYNGLPSLKNAVKVEIIYQVYWDMYEISTPFDATLLRGGSMEYHTQLVSGWDQVFGCSSDITASLSGATVGAYNIRTVLDLENNQATQVIEGPNGFSSSVGTYTLNNTEIANIRNCDEFIVYINNGMALSRVDFYIYNGEVPSGMGPGIYHNSVMGLISYSSDGENWITIADKSIGQEITGDWCNNCYQRGNNHAFEYPWSITPSTTRVDAGSYGPSTYDSGTFINPSQWYINWDTSNNADLWGGVTGTHAAQQGPCPSGFHVPTSSEFTAVMNTISTLTGSVTSSTMLQYLLVDLEDAGVAIRFDGESFYNTVYITWLSTFGTDNNMPRLIQYDNLSMFESWSGSGDGMPIRPFKNSAVVPDATWTVLFQPS